MLQKLSKDTLNKKTKEDGITLIALIVTIIILGILVGVTTQTIVNQGLIKNSKQAAENTKKAQIEEKIKIEMINIKAENPNLVLGNEFATKLAQNLEELEISNASEELITGTWDNQYSVIITEEEVIVEDLGEEIISKVKENVQEMKADMTLTEEDVVLTRGYYSSDDGGSGKYKVVASTSRSIDEGREIQLDNGLIAELIISDKTINVKQYGAYADGIQDDTAKIKLAFEQLKTEECNCIEFAKGTYIVTESIDMPSGTYRGNEDAKIQIIGYTSGKEYVFQNATGLYGSNIETINLESLNVSIKIESQGDRHHVNLFRFYHTEGTKISNCNFFTEEGNGIGVCSIDLYSDNHNVTIENCNSNLYGIEQALNTHISVREYRQNNTTSDITIRNCNMEKNGRDESLWIDAWVGTLENVEISNCNIKDVGISTSMIYLGARQEQAKANNLSIHDCNIEKEQFSYGLLKLAMTEDSKAGCTQNIQVKNNVINIKSNLSSGLLGGTAICMVGQKNIVNPDSKNIEIEDNTFIAEDASVGSVIRDNSEKYITNTKNNQIKINNFTSDASTFNGVYAGVNEVNSDHFSKTNEDGITCSYLFRNCKTIQGITGTINGIFLNNYHMTVEEVLVKDCDVTVSGVVLNAITTSSNLYTIRAEDCKFNNSGNIAGAWYTDLNSAWLSSGEGIIITLKNVTTNKNGTYGSLTLRRE